MIRTLVRKKQALTDRSRRPHGADTPEGNAPNKLTTMRKLLLLLAMLPWAAFAQTPDEDRIIDRTMDSESPYYYPNLMLR